MFCPDCNERPLKLFNGKLSKRCDSCNGIFHRKQRTIKNELAKLKANNEKIKEKQCVYCEKNFKTSNSNQKYCYDPCNPKAKALEKSNNCWVIGKKVTKNRNNFTFRNQ